MWRIHPGVEGGKEPLRMCPSFPYTGSPAPLQEARILFILWGWLPGDVCSFPFFPQQKLSCRVRVNFTGSPHAETLCREHRIQNLKEVNKGPTGTRLTPVGQGCLPGSGLSILQGQDMNPGKLVQVYALNHSPAPACVPSASNKPHLSCIKPLYRSACSGDPSCPLPQS